MSNKNIKKSLIILVACLMLALVAFSACTTENAFTPIGQPLVGGKVEGNGGIAVKYGDYIYYVNGYQSSVDAENTYTNDIRTGAIVRVKASDVDFVIGLNDEQGTSAEITERIASAVKEKVELVVPRFYYSANTTNTALTGLYIFNDRLYITTPNQELTAGGNTQHSQLVLTSYALNGSDEKQHYTFVSNSAEILLANVNGEVYATYISNSNLTSVKVSDGSEKVIAETVSSAKIDAQNNAVFYLDKDGQICQYVAGADKGTVLVEKVDTEESKLSYTITAINDGYVYYTQSDSVNSTLNGKTTFYATLNGETVEKGALLLAAKTGYVAWGTKAVYMKEQTLGDTSIKSYEVVVTYVDNGETKVDVAPLFTSRYSITLTKIVDDVLYYTENGLNYTRNLVDGTVTNYAKGLSTTAQGWAIPDVLGNYTFALTSTGTVTVTKYDVAKETNSTATNITLVADAE